MSWDNSSGNVQPLRAPLSTFSSQHLPQRSHLSVATVLPPGPSTHPTTSRSQAKYFLGAAAGGWDSGGASGGKWNAGTAAVENWNDGAVGDDTGLGNDATANGDVKASGDGGCRICHSEGHFARDCPDKPANVCFNCKKEGHTKAECTEERVEDRTCRLCEKPGHVARDCPDKPAAKCNNCKHEGHATIDCQENRVFDMSEVPDMGPEDAWAAIKSADAEQDLDDLKAALKVYCKAVPVTTYDELERAFRTNYFNTHLVAQEKEIGSTFTLINIQGELNKKYKIGFFFDSKPKRATAAEGWPSSPEENLERLKDAGLPYERGIPKCSRCNELGHTTRSCPEEAGEIDRVSVKCVNCDEPGHRARDCTKERYDRFACRNCKKSGHQAPECPEPRSAEGVECKRCNETGHFAKDCPNVSNACRNCGEDGHKSSECDKPKNPATSKCRNCDQMGHFSKDCPEPKDWSKVKCNNCGEMGHTVKRCKQPVAGEGDGGYGEDAGGDGGAASGGWDTAPATEPTGDWNAGPAEVSAW